MPLSAEEFEQILTERLEATKVEVEDQSGGCGTMFRVLIVSPKFEGLKLIERQRLVNESIQEEMKQIHALSFKKTITPAQYEELKDKLQQQQQ